MGRIPSMFTRIFKRVGPMGDLLSNFCATFAILGAKLLYWNGQPVTFGSVVLTVLISLSVSHLITGATAASAGDYYKMAIDTACAYQDHFPAIFRTACHTTNTPAPDAPPNSPTHVNTD